MSFSKTKSTKKNSGYDEEEDEQQKPRIDEAKRLQHVDEHLYSPYISFLVQAMIHSFFIFLILSALFAFYLSSVSETAFNNEISSITRDTVINTLKQLDSDSNTVVGQNPPIKQYIIDNQDNLKTLYNIANTQDEVQLINNQWLFITNFMVIAIVFFFVCVFIVFIMYMTNYQINLKDIASKESQHLPFMLLAEAMILVFIALRIVPASGSNLAVTALNRARSNLTVSSTSVSPSSSPSS